MFYCFSPHHLYYKAKWRSRGKCTKHSPTARDFPHLPRVFKCPSCFILRLLYLPIKTRASENKNQLLRGHHVTTSKVITELFCESFIRTSLRRSQKIGPCSIFCDRLRSFAIVCDQLRSYGNQSSAICDRNVSYIITYYINNSLHLARKCARIFVRGHYLFRVANSFPRA